MSDAPGTKPLLRVEDLRVSFGTTAGELQAVDGVTFDVQAGEVVALVGESGSGKSVTVRSVIGLESFEARAKISGTVDFDGQRLTEITPAELRSVWQRKVGMVFQDPLTSLNPVLKVGDQIIEVLRQGGDLTRSQARTRAEELLAEVRIPSPRQRLSLYPHELSGGMRQRVAIAIAMANSPKLLVADEPTTALDVTVQRQLLDLMMGLVRSHGMSLLLVTHNLALVSHYADRALIMYAGRVIEEADAKAVMQGANHPYTRGLIGSIPTLSTTRGEPLTPIAGNAPDMRSAHQGCAFAPRCAHAIEVCATSKPDLLGTEQHRVACHVADVPTPVRIESAR